MHQFILDNIGVFLGIIVIAQAIILYGQSQIYIWTLGVVKSILTFMAASKSLHEVADKEIQALKSK